MKQVLASFALFVTFAAITLLATERKVENYNLEDSSLAIQGYDPVAYFSGKAIIGNPKQKSEYDGITYHFSSEANKEAFDASPNRYEPQYGGWCAYAMIDGDQVSINPKTFKIIEGKLYLFYDSTWGDTLKRWNKKTTKTPESDIVDQADDHWSKIEAK